MMTRGFDWIQRVPKHNVVDRFSFTYFIDIVLTTARLLEALDCGWLSTVTDGPGTGGSTVNWMKDNFELGQILVIDFTYIFICFS